MLLQPALENLRLAAFERQSSGASLSLGLCDIKPKKRGTGVSVVCKFLPKSRFRRGKLPVMERDAPASAAARDGQTDAPRLCQGTEKNKFGSVFYRNDGAKSTQAKSEPVSSQP